MAVPRAVSLAPGVAVNIVLKKDQLTGRLTFGTIKDLLSRGDHPRGIKVRLQDGQIGRVQSLAAGSSSSGQHANTGPSRQYKMQDDVRNDPQPPSSEASLEDYIKVKPAKKGKGKKPVLVEVPETDTSQGTQAILEKEFPSLDSSLIAAIVHDTDSVNGARSILGSLPSG